MVQRLDRVTSRPYQTALKTRSANLSDDFFRLKEISDLDHRILVAVRSVHRVCFDALRQFLADRAGLGVGGVGCAHDIAVALHGVFTFEDLDDDGAGDHEIDEFAKERPLAVDGVEALGLFPGHGDAL